MRRQEEELQARGGEVEELQETGEKKGMHEEELKVRGDEE